jgi:phosphoserine phosphatase RsbU/P
MSAPENPAVLIADDQDDIRVSLQLVFKREGFRIETADSPAAVLAAVARRRFDLLLMDLNYTRDTTSGGEGLDLLLRLKDVDETLPIVAMTAWATIDLAVTAMRHGAGDFVLKPWDNATLLETVRRQLRARSSPGRRDLDAARQVQHELLPRHVPRLGTLECAAQCIEAGAVGGDGYDFFDLGRGRAGFVIGDASGKGVRGALLWANLQATLRSRADRSCDDLPGLAREVNRLFCASTAPEHFATLFLGTYDDEGRRFRYVNCGHNPPLLLRASGGCDRLLPTAPVVGLLDDWDAMEAQVTLDPGDTLILYSDGVTEARDAADEEFGEERLIERARALRAPLAEVPGALLAEVELFAGGRRQDDKTLVALRASGLT